MRAVSIILLCLNAAFCRTIREAPEIPHDENEFNGNDIQQMTIDQVIMNAAETSDAMDFIQNDGTVRVELDMVFDREQWETLKAEGKPGERSKRKAYNYRYLHPWTGKVVPYQVSNVFSQKERIEIDKAFREWNRLTCLHFRPATGYDKHKVILQNGNGCNSRIGMNHRGPSQSINLGKGCRWKGTVIHELGHAIGFFHEQSRPDRDRYVTILNHNIAPSFRDQFERYSEATISTHGVPYDYKSIMHYGKSAFTMNGQDTIRTRDPAMQKVIGSRSGLSFHDIQLTSIIYNCSDHCRNPPRCPSNGFVGKDCKCWCPGNPYKLCSGEKIPCGEPHSCFTAGRCASGWVPAVDYKCSRSSSICCMHAPACAQPNTCQQGNRCWSHLKPVTNQRCIDGFICCGKGGTGTTTTGTGGHCRSPNSCFTIGRCGNGWERASGQTCSGGICCQKKKGGTGTGTTTTGCADLKPKASCEGWVRLKYCTEGKFVPFMKGNCKKSCGLCGGTGGTTTTTNTCSNPNSCFTYGSCGSGWTRAPAGQRCPKGICCMKKTGGGGQTCADKKPTSSCVAWVKLKYCVQGKYVPFMKGNCKKSCGLCGGTGGVTTTTTTTNTCAGSNSCFTSGRCGNGWTPARGQVCSNRRHICCKKGGSSTSGGGRPSGDCRDQNNNCKSWAQRGECRKNPAYMLFYCKRSCDQCGMSNDEIVEDAVITSECKDEQRHCKYWSTRGECEKNPGYMLLNCKKSCDACL